MFRKSIYLGVLLLLTGGLMSCGVAKDKHMALQEDLKKCQSNLADANSGLRGCNAKLAELSQTKEQLEEKTETYDELVSSLKNEIESGKVKISEMRDRLTVNLIDKILFASGKDEIQPEGKVALKKVATILKDVDDKRIQVEGHTDNVPVGPSLKDEFPTNWELSTARATAVVKFMIEQDVGPTKLSATGFSMYQPVASNDSVEGRRQNRRIEIVLVPDLKTEKDPVVIEESSEEKSE